MAPRLEERLAPLRAERTAVMLDLSELPFIDSTEMRLLIQMIGDARIKGWEVPLDPNVTPQVMRRLRLVHLERFVFDGTAASKPATTGTRAPPPSQTPSTSQR